MWVIQHILSSVSECLIARMKTCPAFWRLNPGNPCTRTQVYLSSLWLLTFVKLNILLNICSVNTAVAEMAHGLCGEEWGSRGSTLLVSRVRIQGRSVLDLGLSHGIGSSIGRLAAGVVFRATMSKKSSEPRVIGRLCLLCWAAVLPRR